MSFIPHRRIPREGIDALCQISTPTPGPRHHTRKGGIKEPKLLELKRSSEVDVSDRESLHKNRTVIRVTSRQLRDSCVRVKQILIRVHEKSINPLKDKII